MSVRDIRVLAQDFAGPKPKRHHSRHSTCIVCAKATSENKPACADHLLEVMPHYAKVAAEIAEREHEKTSRQRPLYTDKLVADALQYLQHNAPLRVGQLSNALDVPAEYAAKIAALLHRRKLARYDPDRGDFGVLELRDAV